MSHTETFTGQDAVISVGTDEYEVTNVSYQMETQTSAIQQETDLDARNVISGTRYSGSFEYQGINNDWIDEIIGTDGQSQVTQPQTISLSIKSGEIGDEDERLVLLQPIVITNLSRDISSDDVATTTFNFVADGLLVTDFE